MKEGPTRTQMAGVSSTWGSVFPNYSHSCSEARRQSQVVVFGTISHMNKSWQNQKDSSNGDMAHLIATVVLDSDKN